MTSGSYWRYAGEPKLLTRSRRVLRFNKSFLKGLVVIRLCAWFCRIAPLAAQKTGRVCNALSLGNRREGDKRPEIVPDEEVTEHVGMAQHLDRYFHDGHVTVKDGVVHFQGTVFEESDPRRA